MRSILFVALALCASPAVAVTPLPYVIVTDQSLAPAFAPLAAAHSAAGLAAEVHTMQEIQALYPVAADDAERVRLFLKDLHAQRGLKFALLGGDDPLVPMRRAYIRGPFGDVLLPTDEYYACLAGTWDADGDGRYGENPNPSLGEIGDGQVEIPDLAVGRAPVSTPGEAQVFVDKAIAFAALDPARPIRALLAADALPIGPDTLDTAPNAESIALILSSHPTHFVKLYQRWYAWPGAFPESRGSLLDSLNAGYDVAYLDGSGGAGAFQAGAYPADLVFAPEFGALANAQPGLAFFMSAFTTQPGAGSVGRAFVLAPLGGAASVIGSSDVQFTSIGAQFARGFFHQAIELHAPTQGEAMAATVASLVSFSPVDNARLTTIGNVLFGDPALPVSGSKEPPVPVLLSLVDADTSPGEARLSWYAAEARGGAIVERRTSGTDWTACGNARALGQGSYEFVDRVPAGRYGYRLRIGGDMSDEAWLDVPAAVASLALAGFRPNPASAARTVSFSLASNEPATLQLIDVRGRTVARREVGGAGPGPHTVDLGGELEPGVYWLRLVQGADVRETRGVVAR